MAEEKRTVSQIIIEKFLKEVEETGTLPWQRPYACYNAFNYFTGQTYRGINRLMLQFGEYLTANQINQYNKEKGEDFRFQKGIKWYPVVFFNHEVKESSLKVVTEKFPDATIEHKADEKVYIGREGAWTYYTDKGKIYKSRNILKYSNVAERKWFKNSKGELLPSKIETGEVEITLSDAKEVLYGYIEREGIQLDEGSTGIPCYIPKLDVIELNKHSVSQEAYFSTAFHECGHSTGAKNRLNREGIVHAGEKGSHVYAVEECIAEICAHLCCAECGITEFTTSGTMEYQNNIAYVQAWKKHIKDFDKEFIYICSQADKAFNFIMGMDI